MEHGHAGERGARLKGWKQIAAHFDRDASTVRRWAADKGLPVHRVPGGGRSTVYAYRHDLDHWLKSHGEIEPGLPAAVPDGMEGSRRRRAPLALALAGCGLAGALALGLFVWNGGLPATEPARPFAGSPAGEKARGLYGEGVYLFEKRTPQSLPRAAALLEEAAEADPGSAEIWSALASTYNVMVEYRVIDAGEGYARSRAAAERAVALDPTLASAHSVLADLEFFWQRDRKAGLARFEQATLLNPRDAQTRHWYASALALSGEPSRALVEIGWARYLDPSSRSIMVSEAIALLSAGRIDAARDQLRHLVANEPNYANPYRFLSFASLAEDDYAGYLDALATRFALRDDAAGLRVIDQGRAGLARSGRDGMARAMLAAARSAGEGDGLEHYFVAHVHALAGECATALDLLAKVPTRHAFYSAIDPAFAPMRDGTALRCG